MPKEFKGDGYDRVLIEHWDWYTTNKICMWLTGSNGLSQLVVNPRIARKIGKELIRLADKSKERKTKNVKRRTA